ncbi:MAG TPA: glycosyltransferase family 4 protein [Opitutaceae bacterium]|nr:glycosyltransferase family 4 protein [Opitutaceae bacterium]
MKSSPLSAGGSTLPLLGENVGVLLYSYYLSDPRPRRAAETLAGLGANVEVLCLRQNETEPFNETVNGVKIRRLPIEHRRGGKFGYMRQYATFILSTFFILGWRALRKKYRLIHVHNMPDVLVFSAMIAKLRGAKIILDLHDPMPELMMTIFGLAPESRGVRLMKRIERISIWFADAVITVNQGCKDIFSARSCRAEKIHVVMNSPDESIFAPRTGGSDTVSTASSARPFVIMYHGSIVERHGLDLAVEAVKMIRPAVPQAELWIYGRSTPFLESVMKSVEGTDAQDYIKYFGPKKLEQVVEAIRNCDVGIIPNRRSIFTELNTPTRIFEYLSQDKAVIAPRAKGICDYFGSDDLFFFELGDAKDMAKQILYVANHPSEVRDCIERGQEIYRQHSWSSEKRRLIQVATQLLDRTGRSWTKATSAAAETQERVQ